MGYLRRTSNYSKRISLSDPTHMMSIANPITMGVETLRIDILWVLFAERIHYINMYEFLNDIIPNCQSGLFMSQLCIWSFDLRHQRHPANG